MITNLDPASGLFLANVERIQDRLATASRQVSSGKRISQPSDAPDQIDSLLQLRSDRQRNTQIQSNLGYELTYAQSADGALSGAIKLMDQAIVLAAQGANSVSGGADPQTMADQAQGLLDRMLAYSQTAVQGRHVFGGDPGDTPSYQADPTSPTGVLRLSMAPPERRIEDPAGGSYLSGKSAQEIFDSRNSDDTVAGDNVFGALNGLKIALASGDPTAVAACRSSLEAASAKLNSVQAFYGGVQNRIQDSVGFAQSYDIDLQKQLSQKEDADVAAAALEITQGGTQLQAAFQMRSMLPQRSLFEYLG
jgi:flagellar hook-associated protein 3 FlgL